MSMKIAGGRSGSGEVEVRAFGDTRGGLRAELYRLTNMAGMEVALTNYGATVVSLKAPDREGNTADVVLGFDTVGEYEEGAWFFGGTIGRFGNRIAGGKFTLEGKSHTLPKKNGENTLHGGLLGFHKRMWSAKEVKSNAGVAGEFTYLRKDDEEGFPGNLTAKVLFTLL